MKLRGKVQDPQVYIVNLLASFQQFVRAINILEQPTIKNPSRTLSLFFPVFQSHAIAIELFIKMFYALDRGEEYRTSKGRHSHDIIKIFDKLQVQTQKNIQKHFDIDQKRIQHHPDNRRFFTEGAPPSTLEYILCLNEEIIILTKYGFVQASDFCIGEFLINQKKQKVIRR